MLKTFAFLLVMAVSTPTLTIAAEEDAPPNNTSGLATLLCDVSAFPKDIQGKFTNVRSRGLYRRGFERSEFVPDDTGEAWWVYDQELAEIQQKSNSNELRVEIAGLLSPEGRFGHGGSYKRCITKIEIIRILGPKDSIIENGADSRACPDRLRTDGPIEKGRINESE